MNKTLKPCPFCGGSAFLNLGYSGRWVECRGCGAEGPPRLTDDEAFEAWNTRACTVAESDAELYEDIMQALYDDLAHLDKDKAELWARAWPELFGKENDGCDLV